jgi:ribosomal protein S27AE
MGEMMALQGIRFYTIDLTKLSGKGEFRCPKCRVEISPDDQTERTYMILEPVMKDNCLEKLRIQCNKCGTQIQLVGFNALSRIR